MNRIIIAGMVVAIGTGLIFSACKRNSTIGAVGYPMDGEFPQFDTFVAPTAKYYFYGRFDGHYTTWEDSLRSKWDTATRICTDPTMQWNQCPAYTENIYYNFAEEGIALDTCPLDTLNPLYYHRTRFIRPEIADQRIDIFFYDCVDFADTNDPNYPANNLSVLSEGAYPFTNREYGRNGVEVVYIDEFRDEWRTKPGSGQLLDTYFRLTNLELKPLTDSTDTFAVMIGEGEFAGRLYNDFGTEKIVTEAKFRVRLVPRPDVP